MCPALPALLSAAGLHWGAIPCGCPEGTPPTDRLAADLRSALDVAQRIIAGGDEYRTAVLWLLVGLPPYAYRSVLEPAFESVRAACVARGVMIGCFHPYRQRRSRVVPTVATMRSPAPLVVMRRLLRSDWLSFVDEPDAMAAFAGYFGAPPAPGSR
ncbi:DUF6875 domain-containing protein [Micromonospora sp. DT41]|uniref:DUF6875 domain-containing protein n=1 Tax=Micromonospora sp. DT41 TaxID=3393437 RepID=UPI003CF28E05